jgi:hypothetical protein
MTRYGRIGILAITWGTEWAMDCISLILRRIDFSNARYEESKKSKSLNNSVSLDTNTVATVTKMGKWSIPPAAEPPAPFGPEGIRLDFEDGSRVMPRKRPASGWRLRLHHLGTGNPPFRGDLVSSTKRSLVPCGIDVRDVDVSGETTPDETGYRPSAEHLRASRRAEFLVGITAEQVIATIRRVPAFAGAPETPGPDPVIHS